MIPHYFPKDPRFYLRQELELRQKRRPQYSLRAFARDMEISPSFLCEFLAGRQGLSRERVEWLGGKLGLSSEQQEHFWDLIESKFGRSPSVRKSARVRLAQRTQDDQGNLSLEKFRLIAEWYHFALLEILGLPESRYTNLELAEILGISSAEVREAIHRLASLGLLELSTVNGVSLIKVCDEVTSTVEQGASRAIQIAHQQTLQLHADQIEHKSIEERETLSVCLSIAQSDWEDLRRELKESVLKVLTKFATREVSADQVVSFTMQGMTLLPNARPDNSPSS
ncbi:MAG: TIGR02147 family protein [Bdellovibrionales bacterium]